MSSPTVAQELPWSKRKTSETMPEFAAVKKLDEQHVVSYSCSGASLVQVLCMQRSLLQLQGLTLLGKIYMNTPIDRLAMLDGVALES